MTAHLFRDLSRFRKENAAYSAVDAVITKMVETAADSASKHGIKRIGLTGGVSYSLPISQIFVSHVRELGLEPVIHDRVPNGDGGISVGQTAIALKRLQ